MVPGRQRAFSRATKGLGVGTFKLNELSGFHVGGRTDKVGRQPGSRVLGCGPSCVTWRQSLSLSVLGPASSSLKCSHWLVSESAHCARGRSACSGLGPQLGCRTNLSRTREGKRIGPAGPEHAHTGRVRPWFFFLGKRWDIRGCLHLHPEGRDVNISSRGR